MATIKVKYRPSSLREREGRIYYQITHERKSRQVPTRYRIFPSEWDEEHSTIKFSRLSERSSYLLSIHECVKSDLERFDRILHRYDEEVIPYSAESIIEQFNRQISDFSIFNEMEKAISRLSQNGKFRTSQTYASTLRSFRRYRHNEDIPLNCLSSEIMEGYQAWLQQQGVSQNTISFYIRILRAVYNRAVDNDLTDDHRPFRHVYTGVDKTIKRALSLSILKKIKDLDLSLQPDLSYARDMFMLSFMLRGMSFIDMAYLKKSDLINGHIIYRRRKTRQQLIIAWTPEMQQILNRYPKNKSDYLLPIIKNPGTKERFVFKNVAERINLRLKKIAKMVGIDMPLSMYVARHSWASIAKAKGISLSLISEGLGHEKESTTRIYLATLDSSAIHAANNLIIKLL